MNHDPSRRGKPLDVELMMRYREAIGPLKRRILGQLLYENEPLVTVLVDQLCGRGPPKRGAVKLAGCEGFSSIPWEDAKQAGLMAFMKAMDCYDPAKGKISFFVLMKARYEIQCIVQREGLARVARGETGIGFDLVGEQQTIDDLTQGHDDAGLIIDESFSPEDVARWQASGMWPEDIDAARLDSFNASEIKLRRDPEAWAETQAIPQLFVFRHASRIALSDAYNDYRLFCRKHRAAELDRSKFFLSLRVRKGVRDIWVRSETARSSGAIRGLAGIAFKIAS